MRDLRQIALTALLLSACGGREADDAVLVHDDASVADVHDAAETADQHSAEAAVDAPNSVDAGAADCANVGRGPGVSACCAGRFCNGNCTGTACACGAGAPHGGCPGGAVCCWVVADYYCVAPQDCKTCADVDSGPGIETCCSGKYCRGQCVPQSSFPCNCGGSAVGCTWDEACCTVGGTEACVNADACAP